MISTASSGTDDLFDIGWEDYLQRGGVCAVEWSENAPEALEGAIEVRIASGADRRKPNHYNRPEANALQILAIETSAKAASAALVADGVLKAEYFQNSGQTHSRTLLKLVQDMLQNCDTPVAALDAVACAIGPGSFTGVRIGLAAAKGLCWGADLPLYGVSTLAAMAYGAGQPDGLICPVMDARRSQVYTALFCAESGKLRRLAEDQAIALDDWATQLRAYAQPVWLVGDGAALAAEALAGAGLSLYLAPEHLRQQRAAGVALAALGRGRRAGRSLYHTELLAAPPGRARAPGPHER